MRSIKNNQYVIVTGATSGIGKALCYELSSENFNIIMIARRKEQLNQIKEDIKGKYQVGVEYFVVDLEKTNEIETRIEEIFSKFNISGVINNAGIGHFVGISDIDVRDCEQLFKINVIAPMMISKVASKYFSSNNNRNFIINMASVLAFIPSMHSSEYCASKAALISFSDVMRIELKKHRTSVLTVNPITVRTNFFTTEEYFDNIKKVLTTEAVAKKVVKNLYSKKRNIHVPRYMKILVKIYQLMPNTMDRLIIKYFSTH